MTLEKLINALGLNPLFDYEKEAKVKGITSDSRLVKPGYVFFALKGENHDGCSFIEEAVKNGALAVFADRKSGAVAAVPLFECENSRKTLAYALDAFYGYPSEKLKVIAITGTNGKTTIASMLAKILENAGLKTGIIGTTGIFGNGRELKIKSGNPLANMTTPDPEELYFALYQMKKCGIEYVVAEASSHSSHFDKLSPLYFIAAVFSNLSPEHLDLHGNIEKYFQAKKNIVRKSEKAIINTDDPFGKRLACEIIGTEVISVSSCNEKAKYRILNKKTKGTEGTLYTFSSPTKETDINLPLPGEYNIENSALAVATALEIGIPMSAVKTAVESFCGVPGRLFKVSDLNADFSVFIDYAHTPRAFEAVLTSFGEIRKKGSKIITLFGCGGDRDKTKRPIMGEMSAKYSDYVILTSDNSRTEKCSEIVKDITAGMPLDFGDYIVIENRKKAIEYAVRTAKKGDVILLLGKGHEKYEIDEYGRHPFDEEAVVRGACIELSNGKRKDENII